MDVNTNIGIIGLGVGATIIGVLSTKKMYNLTKISQLQRQFTNIERNVALFAQKQQDQLIQIQTIQTNIKTLNNALDNKFGDKFDTLNKKLDDKFDTLNTKLDDKFDTLNNKLDTLNSNIMNLLISQNKMHNKPVNFKTPQHHNTNDYKY